MYQLPYLGLAIALIVSAIPVASAETRSHGAHQHGAGRIDIAFEGGQLSVALQLPAINLVGFEHAPRDDVQKVEVERVVSRLEDGLALMGPSPAARCRQTEVEIESPMLSAQRAGGETDHHHEDSGHADFEVVWLFDCERPARLNSLTLTLFERFPDTRHLRLQWITESGQGAAQLNAQRARIVLSPE